MSAHDMGLFHNERQANVDSSIAMIEAVIGDLGFDLGAARTDATGDELRRWHVTGTGAPITISLLERADFVHVRIVAAARPVPPAADRAALYERLLTLNAGEVFGAAFAVDGDTVALVSERTTIDLDRSEVADMIGRIRDYAGRFDALVG